MGKIIITNTADGSNTLFSEDHNAHYHSLNGALQESRHIFIQNGFNYSTKNQINILEVGLGTGLNAALTSSAAETRGIITNYLGIDLFPLDTEILNNINYIDVLTPNEYIHWRKIIEAQWDLESSISNFFTIKKNHCDICKAIISMKIDLTYFDAFAPENQSEIWDISIFEKIFTQTNPGGILVTYCSKGIVKQRLRDVGFKVERLPGPIGKRHIIRAIRPF